MDFQLQRLILIDSYSPGRVVEFPLSGGAVLTGRNGRGKTSLLQLIPIFFGESPNRIVGTQANRLNFVGYYLPRITSYVIYEYRRRDVTCLVVLHSSESGSELRYRFVRSGYRPEYFLRPDGISIVTCKELRAHLHSHKVICSEQLSSVTDYRAVIQGQRSAGRERQSQRQLIADYAFVGSGHHLTHIEKIVSGMFQRRTHFQDLQRMVVSCIAEERDRLTLAAERSKIETWPLHYEAYQTVMAAAAGMDTVDGQEAEIRAAEDELKHIHARTQLLDGHLMAEIARNRQEHQRLTEQSQAENTDYRQHAEQLDRARLEARHDAEQQEKHVKQLDEQQADYERRDLPQKAEWVDAEPRYVDERTQAEKRRDALLGEQSQIAQQYERLLNDLVRDNNEEVARAQTGWEQISQQYEPQLAELEQQKTAEQRVLNERARVGRAEIDECRKAADRRCMEWEHTSKFPQPSPDSVALHKAKQQSVATLHQQLEAAQQTLHLCEQQRQQTKQAYDAQEQQIQVLQHQQENLTQQLAALHLRQNPNENTLLYFLRTQRPDWVFDIARVIREDLLIRTDLAPALLDALPALYGITLNLEPLDAHLAADESRLQQEITAVTTRRQTLEERRTAAQQALTACNQAREATDSAWQQQKLTVQQSEARLRSAEAEEKAAQRQMEKSREAARRHAHEQWEQAAQAVQTLEQQLTDLDQEQQTGEQAIEARYEAERTRLHQERSQRRAVHAQGQRNRQQQFQQKKTELEQERDQRLKAQQVDMAALNHLDAEIKRLRQQINAAREARDEVAQWQLWLKNDWPQRPTLQAAAAAARQRERQIGQQRERLAADWKSRAAALKAQLGHLDQEHHQLNEQRNTVNRQLDRLADYPAAADVLAQSFDPTWTLDTLATQTSDTRRRLEQALKKLRQNVEQLKKAFTAHRGTPPDQFFDSQRVELGPDADERAWIAPLRAWFGHDHAEFQRTLRIEAEQIAGAIVAFHQDMEAFHRKVQQFNRELQQSLDDSLGFESIENVTVEVVSAIRQLHYWPAIEAMAEAQQVWLGRVQHTLPPPEFATALRGLLEHWEVREGIRAELASLIHIQGTVIENGQTRTFRRAADLERVSSNGLSYLILCVIFVAFINRIRRQARVEIVWALDELKDLDIGNIEVLLALLHRNAITLASAFPDPDADVLSLFQRRFSVEEGRRLLEVQLLGLATEENPPETADA